MPEVSELTKGRHRRLMFNRKVHKIDKSYRITPAKCLPLYISHVSLSITGLQPLPSRLTSPAECFDIPPTFWDRHIAARDRTLLPLTPA